MGTVACNRQHNQVIQQHSGPGAGLGGVQARPLVAARPDRRGPGPADSAKNNAVLGFVLTWPLCSFATADVNV